MACTSHNRVASHRHDRHAGEEAPYPSHFLGDVHRDGEVTVVTLKYGLILKGEVDDLKSTVASFRSDVTRVSKRAHTRSAHRIGRSLPLAPDEKPRAA